MIITAIFFILMFLIAIFVHEIGQALPCLAFGLPAGSFFFGNDAFKASTYWKKAIIVSSGIFSLLIFSYLLGLIIIFNFGVSDNSLRIATTTGFAEKAGLQKNDFILAINGRFIKKYGDLEEIDDKLLGDKAILLVQRGIKKLELDVTPVLENGERFDRESEQWREEIGKYGSDLYKHLDKYFWFHGVKFQKERIIPPLWDGIIFSFSYTAEVAKIILNQYFGDSRKYSKTTDEVISELDSIMLDFLVLEMLVCLMVVMLNLVPLPFLDSWWLAIFAYGGISGKTLFSNTPKLVLLLRPLMPFSLFAITRIF